MVKLSVQLVRVDMSNPEIIIGQCYDGFIITIGENRWYFDQEDQVGEKLKEVFNFLGYKNVEIEEVL